MILIRGKIRTQNACYRDDEMGHIAILRDDFQPRDGVAISYDVVEYMWAILLDPSVNKSSAT